MALVGHGGGAPVDWGVALVAEMRFCFQAALVGETLLVALALLASAVSASAAPVTDGHLIHDAGQLRNFEVATDELELGRGRGVQRMAPFRDPAAIQDHAESLRRSGQECRLVLYEQGLPRNEHTRRILTREVVINCPTAEDVSEAVRAAGGRLLRQVPGLPGWFGCEASTVTGALDLARAVRGQPRVRYAEPLLARQKQLKLVPNDPLFPNQWHLLNTGQHFGLPGLDINVTNVWDAWRGRGIVIGVVDTGLETSHPDLATSINHELGWDFIANDPDPSPAPTGSREDAHGSAVAGIAAARGGNNLGVTGVAFEATLAGLRLLGGYTTDSTDAAAILHSNALIHVKNNSWGANDGSGALEGPGPLMAAAFAEGVASGRGGRGTIYVFAGGNGRAYGENVNYDGYANSIHVFAVGAVNDYGAQSTYSEPGACLVVCAPSSDNGSVNCQGRDIATTDLTGDHGYNWSGAYCDLADQVDYTQNFTGTSAAAPIVSGVIALVLQANPALSYRDVKEIVMRSAARVSPTDLDWRTNSAGLVHNHKFGAGLVNAGAAVRLATNWATFGPLDRLSLVQTNLSILVPDNNPAGITNSFGVTNAGFRVEHVALAVTLPHERHGDLAMTLISPAGTESRLAERHTSSGPGYQTWTFSSVRHWGEQAAGVWRVKIADLNPNYVGTLSALHLQLYGTEPRASLTLTNSSQPVRVTLRVPAPGWEYSLETSPNLGTWTNLTTLVVGTDGQANFIDTNAAVADRFYRARLLP
jgi:subtilisin-like proprotein convertase family protein